MMYDHDSFFALNFSALLVSAIDDAQRFRRIGSRSLATIVPKLDRQVPIVNGPHERWGSVTGKGFDPCITVTRKDACM